jgi:Holliday junction resolvase
MTVESALQAKIIKWLRARGFVVIKLSAVPGIQSGMPDILFLIEDGGWGFLEVKASAKAKFQPLQKKWLEKLDDMSFAAVVYPENWVDIQIELLGAL